MKDEFWATFSIYDHRTPIFRQALILFDRIVIPVPPGPVGTLTAKEVDTLAKEVAFLEREGAAKQVTWDPDAFLAWKQDLANVTGHNEALARLLAKDPPHQTRLMLQDSINRQIDKLLPPGALSITAVPAYSSRVRYDEAAAGLKGALQERMTVEVLLPRIPAPAQSVPFVDILRLRQKPSFQASLAALRKWQRDRVRELLVDPEPAGIQRAADEFDTMITKYAQELDDVSYEKTTTAITSALGIGAAFTAAAGPLVGLLSALASPLFSIRSLLRPAWKDLEDNSCFPAGVVYDSLPLAK